MMVVKYTGTDIAIAEGDEIEFDGYRGKIVQIFQPQTEDAKIYCCYETGGMLIEFEKFGLVAQDFDFTEDVHLISRS